MRNPFRNSLMRQHFDGCVSVYESKGRDLFYPDGTRKLGNSSAVNFWRGYDNVLPGQWDKESRKMLAYSAYRAGRLIAIKEEKSKKDG